MRFKWTWIFIDLRYVLSQITKFTGPTWGPAGSCGPQMGPMLAPRTLLYRSIERTSHTHIQGASVKWKLMLRAFGQNLVNTEHILPWSRCSVLILFFIKSWYKRAFEICLKHIVDEYRIAYSTKICITWCMKYRDLWLWIKLFEQFCEIFRHFIKTGQSFQSHYTVPVLTLNPNQLNLNIICS